MTSEKCAFTPLFLTHFYLNSIRDFFVYLFIYKLVRHGMSIIWTTNIFIAREMSHICFFWRFTNLQRIFLENEPIHLVFPRNRNKQKICRKLVPTTWSHASMILLIDRYHIKKLKLISVKRNEHTPVTIRIWLFGKHFKLFIFCPDIQ